MAIVLVSGQPASPKGSFIAVWDLRQDSTRVPVHLVLKAYSDAAELTNPHYDHFVNKQA